jgi:hypothetical protein
LSQIHTPIQLVPPLCNTLFSNKEHTPINQVQLDYAQLNPLDELPLSLLHYSST